MSWAPRCRAEFLLIVIAGGIGLKIWQDQHPRGVVWQQPAAAAVSVTRPLVVVPEPDAAAVGILLDGWAEVTRPTRSSELRGTIMLTTDYGDSVLFGVHP